MMKSKNQKIQNIILKGIAIALVGMFTISPPAYAAESLPYESFKSQWELFWYGQSGSTIKEIEEVLNNSNKLYVYNEIQLRAFAEYVNKGNPGAPPDGRPRCNRCGNCT